MEMPNVTQVTAGAAGAFVAILTLAIQAGVTGNDLLVVAASSAFVASAAMLNDALVRRGRASIQAAEMQGREANLALVGHYTTDASSEEA